MKITEAVFEACAVNPSQFPQETLLELALVGKSNVGKSSLINTLTRKKGLAHTSSTPGKTKSVNFYRINNAFYLVDLPGHGYAKVSMAERREWRKTIDGYFSERTAVAGIISVLDSRREIDKSVIELYEWFETLGLRVITVLTKCDKLTRNEQNSIAAACKRSLGLEIKPILFSSHDHSGRDELLAAISGLLEQAQNDFA